MVVTKSIDHKSCLLFSWTSRQVWPSWKDKISYLRKFGESNKCYNRETHSCQNPFVPSIWKIQAKRRYINYFFLSGVLSGQQMTLKSHLIDLSGSKKLMSKSGQSLTTPFGFISDPTGTIKNHILGKLCR